MLGGAVPRRQCTHARALRFGGGIGHTTADVAVSIQHPNAFAFAFAFAFGFACSCLANVVHICLSVSPPV